MAGKRRGRDVGPWWGLAVVAAMLLALVPVDAAGVRAATISVTTTSDTVGAPGCSLRDAITAANTDTATGNCIAGSGNDTITFALPSGMNTITLLNGELGILNVLTITGPGPTLLAISGGGTSGVFAVAPDATASLSSLTITGGNSANEAAVSSTAARCG